MAALPRARKTLMLRTPTVADPRPPTPFQASSAHTHCIPRRLLRTTASARPLSLSATGLLPLFALRNPLNPRRCLRPAMIHNS